MGDQKEGVFKRAAREAAEMAAGTIRTGDGFALYEYPDYDTYKAVQTAGNKAKLKRQFVKESHIVLLSDHLNAAFPVTFGLCHGTRRGAEQEWFRTHLNGNPNVIGTEISDTAAEFPNTVQWDFHDANPEWEGRADFVYSNSWDHAFDPEKAFSAWIDALRPGGRLLLDHTKDQTPETSNALDPFGASLDHLTGLLTRLLEGRGRLLAPLDFRKTNKEYRAVVVIAEKNL